MRYTKWLTRYPQDQARLFAIESEIPKLKVAMDKPPGKDESREQRAQRLDDADAAREGWGELHREKSEIEARRDKFDDVNDYTIDSLDDLRESKRQNECGRRALVNLRDPDIAGFLPAGAQAIIQDQVDKSEAEIAKWERSHGPGPVQQEWQDQF